MLVLGIASMASAGLTYNVPSVTLGVGESITVQLVSSDGAMNTAFLGGGGAGVFDVIAISPYPAAGDDAYYYIYTSGPWIGWASATIYDAAEVFNNAAGNVFDITILATGLGTGYLDSDYYSTLGANSPLTVNVPEPLTIGLLGLGGLFLRRRK